MSKTDTPADFEPGQDGAVTGEVLPARTRTEVQMRGSEVVPQSEAARFIAAAKGQAVDDPEAVSLAIIDRILNASSLDEILGQPEVTHSAEMIDVPFELVDVRWSKSGFDSGPGFYAMLEGVTAANGDKVTISCSAQTVMAQAFAMKEKGFLPASVVLRRAKTPTASGFYPLHLEPVPPPFE